MEGGKWQGNQWLGGEGKGEGDGMPRILGGKWRGKEKRRKSEVKANEVKG